jgi:hypothetical protein
VYRASPPDLGAGACPLLISGAVRRVFGEQADSAPDPAYRTYLADMVRPYGLSLREEALSEGRGQSYGDMAGALLAQAVPADQPADLLVVAFAVPDVMPWRYTASHLSHLCPGNPMAFAVCDCGTTAGFTGLRLIRAHAVGTNSPRAVLVVLEQAAVHHELAVPAATPARHAAVALRCDQAGSALLDSVRLRTGIAKSEVGRLLAAGLAELSASRGDVTVIAGTGLANAVPSFALPVPGEVVVAPAGQPSTGVWWEVAGRLNEWATRGRRVLVADYDPLPGSLCLAAIDVVGSSPR